MHWNTKALREHMLEYTGAVWNEPQTAPELLIQVASISQNSSKFSWSWGKKTQAFKYSYITEIQSCSGCWELKKVCNHTEIWPAFSTRKTKMLSRLTSSLRTSIKTSTFQVWAWLPSLLSLPSLQIPLPGAEIDCKSNTLNQTLVKNKAVSTPTGYRTPCTRKGINRSSD